MKDRSGYSLRRLSRDIKRIERMLGELAEKRQPCPTPEISSANIRAVLAARRLRSTCFAKPVGELGWLLILEAFAARLDNQLTPTTCLGQGLPRSTAHRWAAQLVKEGILVREADPQNSRTILVGLSDDAAARVTSYLSATFEQAPWLF